jgi:hypothetical protein
MKAIAISAYALALMLTFADHANAQAVSSGMLSGPSAGYKKRLSAQSVATVSQPRAVASRRSQPDPVTTGSVAAKPKN